MPRYLTTCKSCGGTTSSTYAQAHDGQCKQCADPGAHVPTRNERILEHGYQAYAIEEDHYDIPDNA